MRFLSPFYVLGALAAAAPIVLHLFGRERATRHRFPAARLLAAALRKRSPHARLEAWLLVALRALAVAAIATVLSRPIWENPAMLPSTAGLRQAAVLVLDDSMSMSRRADGGLMFERARKEARALVHAFAEGSEVAILSTSDASSDPMAHLERERERVLTALDHAHGSLRYGDTTATLARAATMLAGTGLPYRRIYLVSDLAASGFDEAQPRPFPDHDGADGIGLTVLPVGAVAPPNDAVIAIQVEPNDDAAGRGLRVSANVRASGRPTHARTLSLLVDGEPVARGLVALPPDGVSEKRFEYAIPAGTEPRWVEVALEPDPADALPDDDRRAVPVHGSGGRVILVDGAPGASRREDETFYLETALRAALGSQSSIEVIHEEALTRVVLDDVAAVFVCNPRASPALSVLVPYVNRGGGVFLSVGDNLDAASLSSQLGAILPSEIEGTRDLSGPGGVAGGALRLTAPTAPLVGLLPSLADERGREGWRAARTYRLALFHPIEDNSENTRQVLARFEDGTPALLERRVGKGRVIALATSVDRAWSDLAIQPIFPALAAELSEALGSGQRGATESELVRVGGRPHRLWTQLAAEEGGPRTIEITRPNGSLCARASSTPNILRRRHSTSMRRAATSCARSTATRPARAPRSASPVTPTRARATRAS